MLKFKYDIAKVFVDSKNEDFYFIWNLENNFLDSQGMDFSSLVYFLMFKLRDYGKDYQACVELLKKDDFDFKNKYYYSENELIKMKLSCDRDEKKLFNKHNEEINVLLIDPLDELLGMRYIYQFKPNRKYYGVYSTFSEIELRLIEIVKRESNFKRIMDSFKNNLIDAENFDSSDIHSICKLIEVEDFKYLISGQNGDLWCDLFLNIDLEQRQKFTLLYQSQPKKLMENKNHQHDLEYVRYAIDGSKFNQEQLITLFEMLPKSVQKNQEIRDFYNWHLEKKN